MSKRMRLARRLRRAVAKQPDSGLTISAYCRKHRIAPSTFAYWRKRIRFEQPGTSSSIPVQEPATGFVRIIPEPGPLGSTGGCELSYPDGRVLRFQPDFPVETLLAILKVGVV